MNAKELIEQAAAMQHALKPTLYEQLEALPEGLTGEILNGQLHAQPRPAGPHALADTRANAGARRVRVIETLSDVDDRGDFERWKRKGRPARLSL